MNLHFKQKRLDIPNLQLEPHFPELFSSVKYNTESIYSDEQVVLILKDESVTSQHFKSVKKNCKWIKINRNDFFFLFRNKVLFKNYNISQYDITYVGHTHLQKQTNYTFLVLRATKNLSVVRCSPGWHMAFFTFTRV